MDKQCQIKSGFLSLLTPSACGSATRLMVVAYTHMSEPFVEFHRDTRFLWNKPMAFLRLKDCDVRESGTLSFTVSPKGERIGAGAGTLEFSAESREEKESWMKALDFRAFPVTSIRKSKRYQMPAIQELTEETESRQASLITA